MGQARLLGLTNQTSGGDRPDPREKRARLVSAARQVFAQDGYEASVQQICRVAGVGIGTFYHQFLDKADLMRSLMDEEHAYRIRAFDAMGADPAGDAAVDVVRVLSGSDPALLRAMIEACGIEPRLRNAGLDMRRESRGRLAAAFDRVREARGARHPALDSTTAASATLALGDTELARDGTAEVARIVNILAFAESNGRNIRV